jgi:hypothetical protein
MKNENQTLIDLDHKFNRDPDRDCISQLFWRNGHEQEFTPEA